MNKKVSVSEEVLSDIDYTWLSVEEKVLVVNSECARRWWYLRRKSESVSDRNAVVNLVLF